MPMFPFIGEMIGRPTAVCTGGITRARASGRSTNNFVSLIDKTISSTECISTSFHPHLRRSRGEHQVGCYRLRLLTALCCRQIINNFAGQSNESAPPFANANDAFALYNAEGNYDAVAQGEHYYDFRYGDVAFFVMDTRKHRSVIAETEEPSRTMLGETQLAALYDWLGRVRTVLFTVIMR